MNPQKTNEPLGTNEINADYVRASVVANASLIGTTFANFAGTIGIGSIGVVTTTLTPIVPFSRDINMGVPFFSIFEGTFALGSMQVFPTFGSGITPDKLRINSGYDLLATNGTNSVFKVSIYNNSGSNLPISGSVVWRYVEQNGGTSHAIASFA